MKQWIVTLGLVMSVAGLGRTATARTPELEFGPEGLARILWRGAAVADGRAFALDAVVFEQPDDGADTVWGHRFSSADVASPRATVQAAERRVTLDYAWGRAAVAYVTEPDRVTLHITLHNTGAYAIADVRMRLLDMALVNPPPAIRAGLAEYTLDHPLWHRLPVHGGHVFVTSEDIETPVLLGIAPIPGLDEPRHAVFVQGGVPADKGDAAAQPLLGMPHLDPGATLALTIVLRFADADIPEAQAIRPYLDTFLAAQGTPLAWPDRRPIGRLTIPGSPNAVSAINRRGWFDSARLDLTGADGQARFEERLMAVADQAITALDTAGAQGVLLWNLEGSHVLPAYPFGDPSQVAAIAPEMDAAADALFARFRDAGYRVGVTIRPQHLFFCNERQNWRQGTGAYDPAHETLPEAAAAMARGLPPERIYPLFERLDAKIRYARERWDCTLFMIEDNGVWRRAAPHATEQWMMLEARVLRRLRERHPDVLLIPRYSERYWRPARTSALRPALARRSERYAGRRDAEIADALIRNIPVSLRGLDGTRIGGAPTPAWVTSHYLFIDRNVADVRADVTRFFTGPRHVFRETYWAHAAPYIRMDQRERIVEHLMTLDQWDDGFANNPERADQLAALLVAFEQTPAQVRDWMPNAFSVADLTRAHIDPRRDRLTRAAAWGDILMWDAMTDPGAVRAMTGAGEAKRHRAQQAAAQLGALAPEEREHLLPLSRIWSLGESLPLDTLVEGRPPPNLRTRAVVAADRGEALLLIGWRGEAGHRIRLRPNLPGLRLSDTALAAWHLDTGLRIDTAAPIVVDPDQATGLSVIVVKANGTRAPAPPPAGVMLGAVFAEGLEPVMGDGLGVQPERRGRREEGALQLANADIPYNIVPDWSGGAIVFDLKPERIDTGELRILRLRHHLHADLGLARRAGRTGLLLRARETDLAGAEERERELFAPLPAGDGHWRRIAVSWESGHIELFADGVSLGILSAPVAVRARDATVMMPGLRLGDDEPPAGGRALLDGLAVYDWPVGADELRNQRGRRGLSLLSPVDRPVAVRVWGAFPKEVTVALNARRTADWSRIEAFEVSLHERLDSGLQQVARGQFSAVGGIATGRLAYGRAQTLEFDSAGAGAAVLKDLSMPTGRGATDLTDLLGDMLAPGTPYVLVVSTLSESATPVRRRIEFEVGPDGPVQNRW